MEKPNRELNAKIASQVFGFKVWKHKGAWTENHPAGDRPLRNYSNDIQWAWEVAEHMKITLIPTADGQWFAFVGPEDRQGWDSPADALSFLQGGNFNGAGAAVGENAALAICLAALKAAEKRRAASDVPPAEIVDETAEGEAVVH